MKLYILISCVLAFAAFGRGAPMPATEVPDSPSPQIMKEVVVPDSPTSNIMTGNLQVANRV